jgi:PIN domain nuclease of toxin-antitoxin system
LFLRQNGKIKNPLWKVPQDIFASIAEAGITVKYIQREHLLTFGSLALIKGHCDPSDRLIIAQAITEKMPLISSDGKFHLYRQYGLHLIYNPH